MKISLIANTGIQFYKFEIKINPNQDDVISTQNFYEKEVFEGIEKQYAYYLADEDIYVSKEDLVEEDFLDENNNLKEDINGNTLKIFELDEGSYYTVSDIFDCLDIFSSKEKETVWLPVPFFRKSDNGASMSGPFAWARMLIKDVSNKGDKIKTFKIILAFDTQIDEDTEYDYAIKESDKNKTFALPNNEDYLLYFTSDKYGCGWVRDYLKKIYLKREGKIEEKLTFPYMKYVGYYIYAIKYLEAAKLFPEVVVYSDKGGFVEVDLVLDIGNSSTCGLLFENPVNQNFKFQAVKKLKLQNFHEPEKEYTDPFSMRLAFTDTKFDASFFIEEDDDDNKVIKKEVFVDMMSDYKNFRFPSVLRLGEEASRLINKHYLDIDKGRETSTHYSSPKRYLWDEKEASSAWGTINFQDSELLEVSVEGITNQFKSNGEYIGASQELAGSSSNYSRKSLMTFVYIEIIAQALSQINSYDFRKDHKENSEKIRKLKRITITCPTSIVQHEQIILRECVEEAIKVLQRFYSKNNEEEEENEEEQNEVKIIPAPKELKKNLSQAKERKDWIYDEATCGQLVFLYAEISERYLNNAQVFFDIYGKRRDDVTNLEENALTIGSIDIGGGTTDLMICSYQYAKDQGDIAVIKPHPLYWESFNLAGDDLLKEIVKQVVLEGRRNEDTNELIGGRIKQAAQKAGVSDVVEKMLGFFGTDDQLPTHISRVFRKNFIVQIAIPIALKYLEHATVGGEDPQAPLSFDDIFYDNKPSQELVNYFNRHFSPLKFEEIEWYLSKEEVFSIIENTFGDMLRRLSVIMSAYGCDFVLLAGKPTDNAKIREMFIKNYPVSPERIITLKDYRVGSWYPFANERGYIEDTKTLVSVGASIALMAGKLGKLGNFRLNTSLLRKNLISTSDYVGLLNQNTQFIEPIYLSPEIKKYQVKIASLPIVLGYKQLPNQKYQGRPIYKLDFDYLKIREKILADNSDLEGQEAKLSDEVSKKITNIEHRMPLKVKILRNKSESKEKISIEEIKDKDRNTIGKRFLSLSIMTLKNEEGYWLDTGEFILSRD